MKCLVLNPTDKAVRMRAGTPLGSLHAVSVVTSLPSDSSDQNLKVDSHLSHSGMRQEKEKAYLFMIPRLKVKILKKMIELLCSYRDLMANSLSDLHPYEQTSLHLLLTREMRYQCAKNNIN